MVDFTKYENFILDFGGVLYQIDEHLALRNFIELSSEPEKFLELKQKDFSSFTIFRDYEKGIISTNDFRNLVRKEFSLRCNNTRFDEAWNSTLIEKFPNAEENILHLKKYGRVILLSNTNEIHFEHFSGECKDLFNLFEKCFFSYKLGMRKPDSDIFLYAIKEMGFKPNETLFIDDSISNIEAAKKLGVGTYLVGEMKFRI